MNYTKPSAWLECMERMWLKTEQIIVAAEHDGWGDDWPEPPKRHRPERPQGGAGVREPRKPRPFLPSGAIALPIA